MGDKKFTGLHREQYDHAYRDSDKHHHNQKIMQMFITGALLPTDNVNVRHQITCAFIRSRKEYCNCDPIITIIKRNK